MNKEFLRYSPEKIEHPQKPGYNLEIIAGLIVAQKQDAQTEFERRNALEIQVAYDSLIYANYLIQRMFNEQQDDSTIQEQTA